jgi:hypothetical protein
VVLLKEPKQYTNLMYNHTSEIQLLQMGLPFDRDQGVDFEGQMKTILEGYSKNRNYRQQKDAD